MKTANWIRQPSAICDRENFRLVDKRHKRTMHVTRATIAIKINLCLSIRQRNRLKQISAHQKCIFHIISTQDVQYTLWTMCDSHHLWLNFHIWKIFEIFAGFPWNREFNMKTQSRKYLAPWQKKKQFRFFSYPLTTNENANERGIGKQRSQYGELLWIHSP